jgi:uncharacterized protein (DUF1501 family)
LKNSSPLVEPCFEPLTSGLAKQLLLVAKVIEARNVLSVKRQIFFVALGGFDTRRNQIALQGNLLGELGQAQKAFYNATVKMGVAAQVARPLSVFSCHHFIMGGPIKGRTFAGRFPMLALAGPDDVSKEDCWLPTTSVDQYAATLVNWFGLSSEDVALVQPNLARFGARNLGFMNT